MKTVRSLAEAAPNSQIERLAEMLIQQILEMMPELETVVAWPTEGRRRRVAEMGRIGETPIPVSFAEDGLG